MNMSLKEVYYFTGRLLALGIRDEKVWRKGDDSLDVREVIESGAVNWQSVIEFASNHVMVPTMYLKIKENSLLPFLPEGLADHLGEIFRLSLERNRMIMKNMEEVNGILISGGITPLFMKGAGNIADNLYNSIGERMMSDIDILVHPAKMEDAAALLRENDFFSHTDFNRKFIDSTKHYIPLVKEGWPAFVEIHRMPVNIQYRSSFNYEMAVSNCRPARGNPDMMVMSDSNKMIMNFMHAQLGHGGHYSGRPPLRDLYDLLLLTRRVDPSVAFTAFLSKPPFPELLSNHISTIIQDSSSETLLSGSTNSAADPISTNSAADPGSKVDAKRPDSTCNKGAETDSISNKETEPDSSCIKETEPAANQTNIRSTSGLIPSLLTPIAMSCKRFSGTLFLKLVRWTAAIGRFLHYHPFYRCKVKTYLQIMRSTFGLKDEMKSKSIGYRFHLFALKHPVISRVIYKIRFYSMRFLLSPLLAVFCPDYRPYVRSWLFNREWYKRRIKALTGSL